MSEEDRSYISYYYGLNYEAPSGGNQGAFPSGGFGLLAGRAMRQSVVGGADAGLWLERLAGVPLEPQRVMIDWGGEAKPDTPSDWTSYHTAPEAAGMFAGEQFKRFIDPVGRVGDVLRGKSPYGEVDEINLPSTVREAMIRDVFDAAGVAAAPGMFGSRVSATTLPTFGGLGARGANNKALELAEYGWKHGLDADTVRETTGWFKGMEGKPRFEIDDSSLIWKRNPVEYEYQQLRDILEHKELFKQYPELKNVVVRVSDNENLGSFSNKSWGGEPVIDLNLKKLAQENRDPKDTLIHEIQHWIQQKEGFARGGSPSSLSWASSNQRPQLVQEAQRLMDEWKPATYKEFWGDEITTEGKRAYQKYLDEYNSPKGIEDRWRAAQEAAPQRVYQNLAGEIEARDVSGRRTWDADMRREVPPTLRKDAIIRIEGGSQASTDLIGRIQNRFQTAYDSARKAAGGSSFVDIAVLRDQLGLPQEKIAGLLRRASKEGHAVLELGEPSVVDDYLKGGMVDGKLLVRLDPEFFDNIGSYVRQDVRKSIQQMEVDEIEKELLR